MRDLWAWARHARNLALLSAIGAAVAFLINLHLREPTPSPSVGPVGSTVVVAQSSATEAAAVAAPQPPASDAQGEDRDVRQRLTSTPMSLAGDYLLKPGAPLSLGEHTVEVAAIMGGSEGSRVELHASFWPRRRVSFEVGDDSTDFAASGSLYNISVPKLTRGAAVVRIVRRD